MNPVTKLIAQKLQQKIASQVDPQRVKLARHLLNMKQIEHELARYNLDKLTKSASSGANRDLRIKYAALKLQHAQEKRAFLSALPGFGGLQRIYNTGKQAYNAGQQAGKALNRFGRGLLGGATRAPQAPAVAGRNLMRQNPVQTTTAAMPRPNVTQQAGNALRQSRNLALSQQPRL